MKIFDFFVNIFKIFIIIFFCEKIMDIDYKEYSMKMRGELSNKEMINNENRINHEYFLHKKGAYFGNKEEEQLLQSLRKGKEMTIAELKEDSSLQNFVNSIF